MNVYLLPIGSAPSADSSRSPENAQYELYCEVPVEAPPQEAVTGWFARIGDGFRRALAEGEEERHRKGDPPADRSRGRRWFTKTLAEAVAEQRLLWHLRGQSEARLFYPDDLPATHAATIRDRLLTRDRNKHRRWSIIDTAIGVPLLGLFFLPGPNFLAYYPLFRAVGHFLSMRGAEQGLRRVTWSTTASASLSELRLITDLDPDARVGRAQAIADALGLERLAAFITRVAGEA